MKEFEFEIHCVDIDYRTWVASETQIFEAVSKEGAVKEAEAYCKSKSGGGYHYMSKLVRGS